MANSIEKANLYTSSSNILALETLQQEYNNALVGYQQAYQSLVTALQNQDTNSLNNYLNNVQAWNTLLIDLNDQIIALLQEEDPYYENEIQQRQTNNSELQVGLQNLLNEQDIVNKAIDHYGSQNKGLSESSIMTQQNYMKYILYVIVLIFVLGLFFKIVFFSKSGQSGGGNGSKMNELLFLLLLMVVFLGLGFFFKENAGFVIVFLIIFLYILIKMKMIPNILRI